GSFKTKASPRFGISYVPGQSQNRLRFGWGTGFRLPSFFALGQPLVGNASLRPEHSRSYEAGLVHLFPRKRTEVGVTLFDEHYSDLIDFSPAQFRLVNRSNVTARGVEAEGTVAIHRALSLTAHTT